MSFYRDVLNGFSHTRQSISKSIHLETPTTHGLFWFQVKQLDWKQLIYMLDCRAAVLKTTCGPQPSACWSASKASHLSDFKIKICKEKVFPFLNFFPF